MPTTWYNSLAAELKLLDEILLLLNTETERLQSQQGYLLRIQTILNILLEFGDNIHNVKEENYLFPMLIARGVSHSGIIHKLIMEHEADRERLIKLRHEAAHIETSTAHEKMSFISMVKAYAADVAGHIQQERDELLPIARQAVSTKDSGKLLMAFARIDEVAYGKNALDHYRDIIHKLE